jgi:hypothetical protein
MPLHQDRIRIITNGTAAYLSRDYGGAICMNAAKVKESYTRFLWAEQAENGNTHSCLILGFFHSYGMPNSI